MMLDEANKKAFQAQKASKNRKKKLQAHDLEIAKGRYYFTNYCDHERNYIQGHRLTQSQRYAVIVIFRIGTPVCQWDPLSSMMTQSVEIPTAVAKQTLDDLKNRVKNVLEDYQLREKKLIAKWKSLEFEVETLKDIISQMKTGFMNSEH